MSADIGTDEWATCRTNPRPTRGHEDGQGVKSPPRVASRPLADSLLPQGGADLPSRSAPEGPFPPQPGLVVSLSLFSPVQHLSAQTHADFRIPISPKSQIELEVRANNPKWALRFIMR
jgi:hypothetical protein